MTYDGNGNHSLNPGYKAVNGQKVLPSNHNPPLEDISSSLSMVYVKDGRAPMLANIPMNGFKITGMGNGSASGDAVTVGQSPALLAANTDAATSKAAPVDADAFPITDSAASNGLKKLTWANLKASLKTYFDTVYPSLSAALLRAGGTMTGKLTLDGNPADDLHAAPKQYVDGMALGVGQAWQDVSGSRAKGTIYRNTTGRPIFVAIDGSRSASSPRMTAQVSPNGSTGWVSINFSYGSGGTGSWGSAFFIVPNGHYYRAVGDGAEFTWAELR